MLQGAFEEWREYFIGIWLITSSFLSYTTIKRLGGLRDKTIPLQPTTYILAYVCKSLTVSMNALSYIINHEGTTLTHSLPVSCILLTATVEGAQPLTWLKACTGAGSQG